MKLSLKTRFFLTIAGVASPLIGLLVTVLLIWNGREDSNIEKIAVLQAQQLSSSFSDNISDAQQTLENLANDATIDWTNWAAVTSRLTVAAKALRFSRSITFVAPSGQVLAPLSSSSVGQDLSDRDWFKKAIRRSGFNIGSFILSRQTGTPVIPLAIALNTNDQLRGVLVTSIDLDVYFKTIVATVGAGWVVTLVDPDQSILVRYPNPEAYVNRQFDNWEVLKGINPGERRTGVFHGLDAVSRFYATEPITENGKLMATVVAGQAVDQVHASTSALQAISWAVIGLMLTAAIVVSWGGIRSVINGPLSMVSLHAAQIATGDFASRIAATELPQELRTVAHAVNNMAGALDLRERELRAYQDNLEAMVAARTEELRASQAELVRSNGELQQFAYVASHDLQEPLRMVASFTQLLAKKYGAQLDDQARKYIDFAVDGATRMQTLINDLLTYSRVETQAKELLPTSANDCLKSALINLSVLIAERSVKVETSDLPMVLADPVQLIQLFQNLIGNGIKFNRSESPAIWISARFRDSMVEFRVDDNGIGIGPEFGERVFIIFQRLNSRGEFPGTGIGLAVCKRIVERHGGTIGFEPRDGGGTSFYFTLKPAGKPAKEVE